MANTSIEQIVHEIADDYKKYYSKVLSVGVDLAVKEIIDAANVAIEQFYSSYDPKYYVRWGNIRNHSFVPYVFNNGKVASGGIDFTDAGMFDYPGAGLSTGEIYDRVIFNGLHGKVASESPYDIVVDYVDNGLWDYVEETAKEAGKKQSFKWLFK